MLGFRSLSSRIAVCLAFFALAAGAGRAGAVQIEVWAEDPLVKVFPDARATSQPVEYGAAASAPAGASRPAGVSAPAPATRPVVTTRPAEAKAVAEVAAGEYASFQVVVRGDEATVKLSAEVSPLRWVEPPARHAAGAAKDRPVQSPAATGASGGSGSNAVLTARPARFVGYVPVDRGIPTPPKDRLRPPPARYPDPLLELPWIDVPAGEAQAVWVTVPVPADARPGWYEGKVLVRGSSSGLTWSVEVPLAACVHAVRMGRPRLWVTNWYGVHNMGTTQSPPADSPEYWALVEAYARNMADHFQNVALIPPIALADFTVKPDGRTFDIRFDRFDRTVEIFQKAGVIGRIEGGHIGGRSGAWISQFVTQIRRVKDGQPVYDAVDPASADAEAFHSQFLPALQKHLEEKGWLAIYTQHLGDEPVIENKKTYDAMAKLVRTYAPKLKIIEACHTKDLVGSIDVWVPMLNYLHQDFAHYQERQKAGEEVWYYTCVLPQGEYANRFIEHPLIKTRLLHWLNYRYGLTGYLHWGYNWWMTKDAFRELIFVQEGGMLLPAGDSWLVYPGNGKPLDSIRFEAMRDGIGDHELLSMLGERDRPAAQALAERFVLAFDRYNTDIRAFRAARLELLQRLEP